MRAILFENIVYIVEQAGFVRGKLLCSVVSNELPKTYSKAPMSIQYQWSRLTFFVNLYTFKNFVAIRCYFSQTGAWRICRLVLVRLGKFKCLYINYVFSMPFLIINWFAFCDKNPHKHELKSNRIRSAAAPNILWTL